MNFENEIIKHTQNDNIEYIQFKRLLEHHNVNHAYILSTHNMSFRMRKGYRLINEVKHNLKVMCDNCGFRFDTIVRPDYDHTSNVCVVDSVDIKNEIPDIRGEHFPKTDGLITNKKDITIMSTNADCLLIFLYDPQKNVIGNIHAGWRGTFDRIAFKAIKKMEEEFGCNPQDIEAYFLPGIRKCHFEVEDDVKTKCEENFAYTNRLDEIVEVGEIKEGKQKYLIDNALINKILLVEAGALEKNIVDSNICSICSKEVIHSRRAEGEDFGLSGAFISLL